MCSDDELIHRIIQAARDVHQSLGTGFVEPIYSKAFGLEVRSRGISVEREKPIRIFYQSCVVGRHFLDFVIEGRIIVELKANRGIVPVHHAQVRSYLAASEYSMGLIINFGLADLQWERVLRQ